MAKTKKRIKKIIRKTRPRGFFLQLKKYFTPRSIKRLIFFGGLATILIWLFWGIPFPTKLASDQVPV